MTLDRRRLSIRSRSRVASPRLDKQVVANDDIPKLFAEEAKIAEERSIDEFKYDTNEEMLAAIAS